MNLARLQTPRDDDAVRRARSGERRSRRSPLKKTPPSRIPRLHEPSRRRFSGAEIHLVLDNLCTHKPKRDMWLTLGKNVHFYCTSYLVRFVVEVIDGRDLRAMVRSYRSSGSLGRRRTIPGELRDLNHNCKFNMHIAD